jgi:predicted PurR-regulated permease PerM
MYVVDTGWGFDADDGKSRGARDRAAQAGANVPALDARAALPQTFVTMIASPGRDWPPAVIAAARLVTIAAICAVLYFGRVLLVPLVLAALIAFLLNPLVARLDRWRVPRVIGVLLVMSLFGATLGGLGYVVTGQVRDFAEDLPNYRENIRGKIRDVVSLTRGGAIENVQEAIEDINEAVDPEAAAEGRRRQVQVVAEEPRLFGGSRMLLPVFGAVGTFGLTLLLAIFMMVDREGLRNRLVSLAGSRSLAVTTKAFVDAEARISRYLLMQFFVNASMGVAVGVGLFFIGVPYAVLFGLSAAVLRYVPYVGPWVAAALPILVSVVTAPGWEQVLIVVAMFLVLELLSNNVMEPLLYGHSVGLSSFAVIVAAIFWTWLWGPVGLVIATPITACLVVLASYFPSLEAVGRLLGDRPAFAPHVSLYQRLLARDLDEAARILAGEDGKRPVDESCEIVLQALLALRRDLYAGSVMADDAEFVQSGLRDALEELEAAEEVPGPVAHPTAVRVVGIATTDSIDELFLEIVRLLLRDEQVALEVVPAGRMPGEAVATIEELVPAAVVVPSLPPGGLTKARNLCKRLRGRVPGTKIVGARLGDSAVDAEERARLLRDCGCAEVATSLDELKRTLSVVVRAARRSTGEARANGNLVLARVGQD